VEVLVPLLIALSDPYVFLPLLFVYSILVAVILPTPVEVALIPLIAEPALYSVAALTMGAGKAAGSWVIFLMGVKVDKFVGKKSTWFRPMKRLADFCIWFVSKTSYIGLFLLLTLPFMSDTVPLYVYSLFNHEGEILSARYFIFTNFLAGVNRALILLIVLIALGLNLLFRGAAPTDSRYPPLSGTSSAGIERSASESSHQLARRISCHRNKHRCGNTPHQEDGT
jgi:membrane protein YqaA with SNARE-associated domain